MINMILMHLELSRQGQRGGSIATGRLLFAPPFILFALQEHQKRAGERVVALLPRKQYIALFALVMDVCM